MAEHYGDRDVVATLDKLAGALAAGKDIVALPILTDDVMQKYPDDYPDNDKAGLWIDCFITPSGAIVICGEHHDLGALNALALEEHRNITPESLTATQDELGFNARSDAYQAGHLHIQGGTFAFNCLHPGLKLTPQQVAVLLENGLDQEFESKYNQAVSERESVKRHELLRHLSKILFFGNVDLKGEPFFHTNPDRQGAFKKRRGKQFEVEYEKIAPGTPQVLIGGPIPVVDYEFLEKLIHSGSSQHSITNQNLPTKGVFDAMYALATLGGKTVEAVQIGDSRKKEVSDVTRILRLNSDGREIQVVENYHHHPAIGPEITVVAQMGWRKWENESHMELQTLGSPNKIWVLQEDGSIVQVSIKEMKSKRSWP